MYKLQKIFMLFSIIICAQILIAETPESIVSNFNVDPIPLRDPEVPWFGDPDMTAINDARLVQLWETTVIEYRRNYISIAFPVQVLHKSKEYVSIPKSEEDQEYLINSLSQILNANPVDWNCLRVILILMYAGMDTDTRIPELAHQLFQMPRPMKMSDNQGWSYREMLELLCLQKSAESAQVLAAGVNREYWGSDPFHTTAVVRDNTEMSILSMRLYCLGGVDQMPQEIATPLLQQLASKYSGKSLSQEHSSFIFKIKRICAKHNIAFE